MTTITLLKRSQVAELLGVTVSGLDKLRISGHGPPEIKVGAQGRMVCFALADVEAWLAQNREQPQRAA